MSSARPASRLTGAFLLFVVFSLTLHTTVPASETPPDSKGMSALALALLRLPVVVSMLHIGAHPDDENNALLAYASQGRQARAAYLSLNRGEGGQNLIGSELYDGIGVIRTEELLAARRFDGAEQYFTRAFDFGFSKSADEALELWNKDEALLGDVVQVIRLFRPDVVVSVFAGTPADGHGQHQAAGRMAREAFRAAGDANRFPEQLRNGLLPWSPKKLYIGNTRASFASLDSLNIEVGAYSPALQRSYRELGLAGRSMHRSQDMGAIQQPGPATTTLKLVDRNGPPSAGRDSDLFDGIDTSFRRLLTLAETFRIPDFEKKTQRLDNLARKAIDDYRPFDPVSVLPATLEGLRLLREIRQSVVNAPLSPPAREDMLFLLDYKEQDFIEVVRHSLGLSFNALSDDEVITPGQTFQVDMELLNRSHAPITPGRLALSAPSGWTVQPGQTAGSVLGYNASVRVSARVTVASDARLTRPYWKRNSLNDARVEVESDDLIGLPWRPPDLIASAQFTVNGVPVEIRQPVRYRYADPAFGEIRRELRVAPAISARVTPEMAVAPVADSRRKRPVKVTLRNNTRGEADGVIGLKLPQGWIAAPESVSFRFSEEGQETVVHFDVFLPQTLRPGSYRIQALARSGGRIYGEGYQEIAYPHIETRHLYRDAATVVQVIDLRIADSLRVGYIMGSGDDVPSALQEMGVDVRLLDGQELADGDLSRYDVIVSGIRAYEARPDMIAVNHRLLDYVRDGGTLLVQYNQYVFNEGRFAPYPVTIRRPHDRVTREDAPVRILRPEHPAFNFPNKITDADFEGWVQERGLYFLGEWDNRYTPLMESNDPGEEPKAGGLVEARYGRGRYLYTGYAWFRQLPAGVPGALRLFANLLSLPGAESIP